MNFMYFIHGNQSTRFQASMYLANFYGGDPEFLMVNVEISARDYLMRTGDALYVDSSVVALTWA